MSKTRYLGGAKVNISSVVFVLFFVAILPFISASCWEIQQDPGGWGTHYYWLCNSSQIVGYWYHGPTEWGPFSMMLHGQIETTAPAGYLYGSGTYRAYLQGFNYASPYPATLKCYKRMGTSPNYWWMYTGQQVTLNSGVGTGNSSSWVLAGCPPIINSAQQGGSPPQVRITLSWSGVGGGRARK
ncbi:hypothetical protein COU36_01785 [Candidatus Micrarchaeota archaeon CG10_big_fil_rev_8_21_14_0_10_59_7]|nr:MAG: hypothetical protein COU36_01785 [Candidatus Micrarchaeota archaeon CG10_big_fil_rev_8_21_14_0_10_59_7]